MFVRRVNSVRNKLYEMVKDKLGIDTPKELFNRWLFCLMSNNFNFAQLLDTIDDLDANVIGRELVLSVPYRLQSDYEQCDQKKLYFTHKNFCRQIDYFLRDEEMYCKRNPELLPEFKKFKNGILKYSIDKINEQQRA